jgi:thioredoxin reductase (NADPH)
VRTYPRKKLVMTGPVKVPGYGRLRHREISKEELIAVWDDILRRTGLEVSTDETVKEVKREVDGIFSVHTTQSSYRAQRVVLAIGRRGVPRKLGVPGEELPKVVYSLREPEAFKGDRLLVVGGGDSAVEAALSLAEQPGSDVKLSYRGDRFSRIKPGNLQRVEEALRQRKLEVLWSTSLLEIAPDSVVFKGPQEDIVQIPNDYLFVFIGGELPTPFLRASGVEIETKFGQP